MRVSHRQWVKRLYVCCCWQLNKSQTWLTHLQGFHDCDFFPFPPLTPHNTFPQFLIHPSLVTSLLAFILLSKLPKLLFLPPLFISYSLRQFCSDFPALPLFFPVAGRRLSHPTQLGPERPPAVHPRCALPAEGVQRSHPLPGGDTRLRPRKGGQEERRGEGKLDREGSRLQRETGEDKESGTLEEFQAFHLITSLPLSLSLSLFQIFGSLDEMISHHKNNQLLLIDSKSQAKHTAYLTHPARP